MRSGLILVKRPQRNTTTGKITMTSRWMKPRDANIHFFTSRSRNRNNNSSYMDSLRYVALSKVKSDLFLKIKNEKVKENILNEGLALDENYGASFGNRGLAIYLSETPSENKENLLLKADIENPLVISDLDILKTPEDILVFNIINVNGDPEGSEVLGEIFTKKILAENIDCIIEKDKKDGLWKFYMYNPGKLKIIIANENE